MTVGGCKFEPGFSQIQGLDNFGRFQIKMIADQLLNFFGVDVVCVERVDKTETGSATPMA